MSTKKFFDSKIQKIYQYLPREDEEILKTYISMKELSSQKAYIQGLKKGSRIFPYLVALIVLITLVSVVSVFKATHEDYITYIAECPPPIELPNENSWLRVPRENYSTAKLSDKVQCVKYYKAKAFSCIVEE